MPTDNAVQTLSSRYPKRRAFITGAASGLGREFSRRLAADRWTIGMFDRDEARLDEARAEIEAIGGRVVAKSGDVTNSTSLAAAFSAFVDEAGGLDLMANNAGVASAGQFCSTSLEDWEWIWKINVQGVVQGCQLALPVMTAAGSGAILNIASAAGFISSPSMGAYNATKAAVISISETLFGELVDSPVQVSVAMPAFFPTNLIDGIRAPDDDRELARLLMKYSGYSVERAADDILGGVAAGDLYILLPARLKSVWRMKRWMPMRFLRTFPRKRAEYLASLKARDAARTR